MQGTDLTSFIESNNCGTSLAAGKFCTVTVSFKPLLAGVLTADVRIATNAPGATLIKVALSGSAYGPGVSLSRTSITFSPVTVGSASASATVALTNIGDLGLALAGTGNGIVLEGTGAASFIESNTCGSAVAAGKSCVISIVFKPKAAGPLTALVRIGDNAVGSPQFISLTGTGN